MKLGCQARSFGEGIYPDEAAFLSVVRQIGELGFGGVEANRNNIERYSGPPRGVLAYSQWPWGCVSSVCVRREW